MLHPGLSGSATPVVPSLPGWSGRPFIVTTFRKPAAYSPLSVGVVSELLKMRCPFDRDLFLVVYTMPYCDAAGGTGTSLRQLAEAYRLTTGSMTTTTRVRESLRRLTESGLIRTKNRGKGLAVCLLLTTSQHTRTKGRPLTTSQHTRTRASRPEGQGWADRRQRVSGSADNESAVVLTTSQHTRDTETLEGCPSRASSLGVHEKTESAAAVVPPLGGGPTTALEEEKEQRDEPEPLPMTAALKALSPLSRYSDEMDRPGAEVERRERLRAQAAALAAMEQGDDGVER